MPRRLLQETLDEEKAADEKLSALAEGGINSDAADAAHPDDEDAEDDEAPPARGRKTAKAPVAARKAKKTNGRR